MEDLIVPDGGTLLALLRGEDYLVAHYDLTERDGFEELSGVVEAAMQDVGVTAPPAAIAAVIGHLQSALRPRVTDHHALICAGWALIGAVGRAADEAAAEAELLIKEAADELAAVAALAAGIDPYGDYTARRAA